jgi:hypothetical protein
MSKAVEIVKLLTRSPKRGKDRINLPKDSAEPAGLCDLIHRDAISVLNFLKRAAE